MDNKTLLYEHVATVTKALASPKRLEILDYLSQGEKTVDTLAAQAGISIKLASAHLQDLKSSQLAKSRRDGRFIYYSIADEDVVKVLVNLRQLSEKRLTGFQETLQNYMQSSETMSRIDRRKLIEKAESGEIVVIDVRPRDEYETAHLPYARSVPFDELKELLNRLPKNKEIVAYCRGAYCVLSRDAAELLRKKGYRANHLSEGISEWIAAGVRLFRGGETV